VGHHSLGPELMAWALPGAKYSIDAAGLPARINRHDAARAPAVRVTDAAAAMVAR
jgi:hypothetical protein